MESPLDGLSDEESRRYHGPISGLWRALAGDKSRIELIGQAVGICERYRGLPEIPSGLTRPLRWFGEGPEGAKILAAAARAAQLGLSGDDLQQLARALGEIGCAPRRHGRRDTALAAELAALFERKTGRPRIAVAVDFALAALEIQDNERAVLMQLVEKRVARRV